MQSETTSNAYRKELKRRIVESADSLFKLNGIKSVRMDDIAKALSISKRTLYEIYENKEQVLFEVVRYHHLLGHELLQKKIACCRNVIEILVTVYYMQLEDLCHINSQFFIDLKKYPQVMDYLHKKSEEREANSLEFFKRGIKEGCFLPDVNLDIIHNISKAGIDHVMSTQMYRRYSLQEIYRNVMLLYMRGICTSKGIKLLEKALLREGT